MTTTMSLRTLLGEPSRIAVAGDWHGFARWAQEMIQTCHRHGVSVVVQTGDFGFEEEWPELPPSPNSFLGELETTLAALGMVLLWLDGNHENHERLADYPIDSMTGTRPITPHIYHLPRGYRWAWPDAAGVQRVWMALGGAVSMDRDHLTAGVNWWPEEAISYAEASAALEGGIVDVMVTHDVPAGVGVPGRAGPGYWPPDVFNDAEGHRKLLAAVVEEVMPTALFHGHYHIRYDGSLDLGPTAQRPWWTGITAVHGLAANGSTFDANMALVDPAGRVLEWPESQRGIA